MEQEFKFKGTQGEWVLSYQSGSWLIKDLETYQDDYKSAIAEVYYSHDGKDTAEYNALLIWKAPEMLEMLKKCKDALLELQEYQDGWEQDYEDLKQLLKEATTL